ncbi:hypothetical protein ERO13_D02G094525v2 [Gossypium hirsutum]|nr:hypothetical protein ERO13_D02G094525v2 [Gossypium hirsutum]
MLCFYFGCICLPSPFVAKIGKNAKGDITDANNKRLAYQPIAFHFFALVSNGLTDIFFHFAEKKLLIFAMFIDSTTKSFLMMAKDECLSYPTL